MAGYPFKELRSKFLLAKESEVTDCSSPDFPSELELIPLPGLFFDMVGVRTPDTQFFLRIASAARRYWKSMA